MSAVLAVNSAKPALNPTTLSVENAAKLLSELGGWPVATEMNRADIDAGAPLNADGTVNLVHYAAWLVREGDLQHGRADMLLPASGKRDLGRFLGSFSKSPWQHRVKSSFADPASSFP